jgi:hypothetical protein
MLIYLATPYSDESAAVREERFQVVNRAAAVLMARGLPVYSPISHGHPISLAGELPLGWDFWGAQCRAILAACEKLIVLKVPGWESSKGVTAEMALARELGLPVEFLDPDDLAWLSVELAEPLS